MKRILIIAFFSLSGFASTAQDREVEVTAKRQDNQSVIFSYHKTDHGYFTIVFNFSELTNSAYQPMQTYSVDGLNGDIFTLSPSNKNKGIGYRYNYRYIRGKLNPKANKDFAYVLPYPPGMQCEAVEAYYVNERYFGAQTPQDWKNYYFYTKDEATVTAIRKGVVIDTIDRYDDNPDAEFTSQKNCIYVEQEDGTLVRYLGFKKGSLKVTIEDEVFPNTPLGLNALTGKKEYGISILIYYLSSIDFESLNNQTLATPKSLYSIISPKFVVEKGSSIILENKKTYQSYSDEELITKEMTKKEKKKYANNKSL